MCVLQKRSLWMWKGSPIRARRERRQERMSLKEERLVKRGRGSRIDQVRARYARTEQSQKSRCCHYNASLSFYIISAGIGGFMVRQRNRTGQSKTNPALSRKDSSGSVSETQQGKEDGQNVTRFIPFQPNLFVYNMMTHFIRGEAFLRWSYDTWNGHTQCSYLKKKKTLNSGNQVSYSVSKRIN